MFIQGLRLMIISSLIKDKKELVKLLAADNKQIIFLISIGQSYHEDENLIASVQVIYDLINVCARVVDDERSNAAKLQSPWLITVIAADTLQAYNHATDEASLKEQQILWDNLGNEWLKKYIPIFDSLKNAGQSRIQVDVQYKKWRALLAEAKEQFNYQAYYDHLVSEYQNEKSKLFRSVNFKSHKHTYRLSKKDETPDEKIKNQWKDTPIKNPYLLQYILEELAVLMGSVSEGLLNQLRKNEIRQPENVVCALLYPSNEEQAFKDARQCVLEFSKSKKLENRYAFQWHTIHLYDPANQEVDSSFLFTSNSDVRNYSPEKFKKLRLKQLEVIDRIYMHYQEGFEHKYGANFPTLPKNYFFNRRAYSELMNLSNAKIVVIQGESLVGKASLVKEFCKNNAAQFTKIIWLDREDAADPYLISMTHTVNKFRLAEPQADPVEIKHAFRQFINTGSRKLIVFRGAKNFAEIAEFIPQSDCLIFVTTSVDDQQAWQNTTNYPLRRLRLDSLRQEGPQYFMQLTQCENQPLPLTQICEMAEGKPLFILYLAFVFDNLVKERKCNTPAEFWELLQACKNKALIEKTDTHQQVETLETMHSNPRFS